MLMIENRNLYKFRDEIENNILAKKEKIINFGFFF